MQHSLVDAFDRSEADDASPEATLRRGMWFMVLPFSACSTLVAWSLVRRPEVAPRPLPPFAVPTLVMMVAILALAFFITFVVAKRSKVAAEPESGRTAADRIARVASVAFVLLLVAYLATSAAVPLAILASPASARELDKMWESATFWPFIPGLPLLCVGLYLRQFGDHRRWHRAVHELARRFGGRGRNGLGGAVATLATVRHTRTHREGRANVRARLGRRRDA